MRFFSLYNLGNIVNNLIPFRDLCEFFVDCEQLASRNHTKKFIINKQSTHNPQKQKEVVNHIAFNVYIFISVTFCLVASALCQ